MSIKLLVLKLNCNNFLQIMVLNVSSLLKTVKAVEDEHTRGTRAMEATVEAISQEIRVSNYIVKHFSYAFIEI